MKKLDKKTIIYIAIGIIAVIVVFLLFKKSNKTGKTEKTGKTYDNKVGEEAVKEMKSYFPLTFDLSYNKYVKALQGFLNSQVNPTERIKEDGYFGVKTQALCKKVLGKTSVTYDDYIENDMLLFEEY